MSRSLFAILIAISFLLSACSSSDSSGGSSTSNSSFTIPAVNASCGGQACVQ